MFFNVWQLFCNLVYILSLKLQLLIFVLRAKAVMEQIGPGSSCAEVEKGVEDGKELPRKFLRLAESF